MKIFHIIHNFPPEGMTGSEVYTYNLVKELSKNHKVSVFYRIKNPQRPEYEIIKERYNGIDVYKINNTLKGYRSIEKIYKNKELEEKFLEVMDEVRPDVVHVQHLLFLSVGIVEEIKKRRIPIVFTLHDYWLVCPRGQLLRHNSKLCKDPLQANCLYCLGRALSFTNLFKRLLGFRFGKYIFKPRINALAEIIPYVDLFIAPSEFLRKKFIEFGLPSEKVVYSDYGMNMSLLNNAEKTKSEKIRFGFIGTLIPSKGGHILIEAFKRMNNAKTTLTIYGNSPVNNGIWNYYRRIKRMANGNGNIRVMGAFDNKNVARIFREIDVLVFPSLWEENSPLILHEALLTQTPVIASWVGGVEELIKDNRSGVLFEPGNKGELIEKMNLFIENPKGKQIMSHEKPFQPKSIEENQAEMENIYKDLIGDQV